MKNLKTFEEYYGRVFGDYRKSEFSPMPVYSKYDMYRDLMTGKRKEFTYQNVNFTVSRVNGMVQVSDGEHTATDPQANSMTDLEGLAHLLLKYKKDLTLDKKGNVINL